MEFLVLIPVVMVGLAGLACLVGAGLITSNTTRCQECSERLPKSLVARHLRCVSCGSRRGRRTVSEPSADEILQVDAAEVTHKCNRCKIRVPENDGVQLWDGCVYCLSCVTAVEPALAAHAARNSVLSEPLSVSRWSYAGATFVTFLLPFPLVLGAWGAVVALAGGVNVIIPLATVALVFALPVSVGFTLVYTCLFSISSTRAAVYDGLLVVIHGTYVRMAPIMHCTWREGQLWRARLGLLIPPLIRRRVILISFYDHDHEMECAAPVGFIPETRKLWAGFLRLAGLPGFVYPGKQRDGVSKADVTLDDGHRRSAV